MAYLFFLVGATPEIIFPNKKKGKVLAVVVTTPKANHMLTTQQRPFASMETNYTLTAKDPKQQI